MCTRDGVLFLGERRWCHVFFEARVVEGRVILFWKILKDVIENVAPHLEAIFLTVAPHTVQDIEDVALVIRF